MPTAMVPTTARLARGLASSRRSVHAVADYVVVGAGSAGCVLANRLSAGGKASVLLLEAGGEQALSRTPAGLVSQLPTALAMPMHRSEYNWAYVAQPEPSLEGRIVSCPRGKGVGGSSAINGMVYVRGHGRDYDGWDKQLAAGGANSDSSAPGSPWDAAHTLPYFRRMESVCEQGAAADAADVTPGRRGRDGPLQVTIGRNALGTSLYSRFIAAGAEAGYGSLSDYNGCRQEGLSAMPMTVFHDESHPRVGQRCSTAAAYLEPALADTSAHPHLQLVPHSNARRILFAPANDATAADADTYAAAAAAASGAGGASRGAARAVGVECVGAAGEVRTYAARKEVLVCAGAIASPLLLQLSGIGDPKLLAKLGIPTVAPLRGVGENLQDHLEVYHQFEVLPPISLAPHMSLLGKGMLGARWLARRDGLGATNHFEAGGFVRSRPGVEHPDVQLHFLPLAVSYDGESVAPSPSGHSLQMHVGFNRSPSRGYVRASAPLAPPSGSGTTAPAPPPTVRFRYMDHEEDWRGFRAAVRIAREIVAQPSFDGIIGEELSPGAKASSDRDLDEYLVEHLESAYHPCGTCKMGGASDPTAVVDRAGRVHGVDGLRVVDASVFPSIPNGNLNAPVSRLLDLASHLTPHLSPHLASVPCR